MSTFTILSERDGMNKSQYNNPLNLLSQNEPLVIIIMIISSTIMPLIYRSIRVKVTIKMSIIFTMLKLLSLSLLAGGVISTELVHGRSRRRRRHHNGSFGIFAGRYHGEGSRGGVSSRWGGHARATASDGLNLLLYIFLC